MESSTNQVSTHSESVLEVLLHRVLLHKMNHPTGNVLLSIKCLMALAQLFVILLMLKYLPKMTPGVRI